MSQRTFCSGVGGGGVVGGQSLVARAKPTQTKVLDVGLDLPKSQVAIFL